MVLRGKVKRSAAATFTLLVALTLVLNTTGASATVPYVTERVNLTSSGNQMGGTDESARLTEISQDGRYVAFASSKGYANDSDGSQIDVFVRDRKLGTIVNASLSSSGGQTTQNISGFEMSENGRYVAFGSFEALVPGDTNNTLDLFVRDLVNNTTERVSLTSSGGQANGGSGGWDEFDMSVDGRYVVFSSLATNLVANDTNAKKDVFVRDRKLGTTTLLSKAAGGAFGNGDSLRPLISCEGSYVTFASQASNLVANDTNGKYDVFLVDRIGGDGIINITLGADANITQTGDIACNGSIVVYNSDATNLIANDANGAVKDIFAYDIASGTTQKVNLDSSGNQSMSTYNSNTLSWGSVDFSGRYVVFSGLLDDMVAGDTNVREDVFIRDLQEGTTQIISKRSASTQTTDNSALPSISLDGREVIFWSWDTGLVSGDTNGVGDIFVSKTGI